MEPQLGEAGAPVDQRPFIHPVGTFRAELRDAPRMHQVTIALGAILNVWLVVFSLAFVPYGVIEWGWGYNLG